MHELSLLADLLRKIDRIAREQRAAKVTVVKVRLGALAHISPEHLREHFDFAVRNTVAGGARLDVEVMTDIADPAAQDILLDSLEVEIAEDAATGREAGSGTGLAEDAATERAAGAWTGLADG
jgi:hydrogenase nickel incorporation protein HypA/HybF